MHPQSGHELALQGDVVVDEVDGLVGATLEHRLREVRAGLTRAVDDGQVGTRSRP